MEVDSDKEGSDSFNWDCYDEKEKEVQSFPSSSRLRRCIGFSGEASSSAGPFNPNLISDFVLMGFSLEKVTEAIKENGEGNSEAILETLLTYAALDENSPRKKHAFSDLFSENAGDARDYISDIDSDMGTEENMEPLPDKETTLKLLVDMGYHFDEVSIAMDRCGPDASLSELADCICAAQMAKEADALAEPSPTEEEPRPSNIYYTPKNLKRRYFEDERVKSNRQRRYERTLFDEEDDVVHIPKPMIGFGIPSEPHPRFRRPLPEAAIGPPYFYYENVAYAPKGVWKKMSSFLYEIEPEFVDSQFFSASQRKRGYIHNLPIENRRQLLPPPPQTIHEAFPLTKKWWPWWDKRTKLNCLHTCTASAKLTERIRKALEIEGDPPANVQKSIITQCKKWNLVWVGRNKTAPLEPDEIETLLGFPKNHTRGGGISRTDRLKGLGNSFQVDTVAYHLSVLKNIFPNGINVLSLFSGIGGAEVALYRLGIPLKNVVAVEISESSRNILRSWWESTNQKGNLIDITDVNLLDSDMLEKVIKSVGGGFDLIIGGSPCNNISGCNRVSRNGLEGKDSSLFFHYFRILNEVKILMGKS